MPSRAAGDRGDDADRHGDDQRARAGDDQDDECPIDRLAPLEPEQRQHQGHDDGQDEHRGRVDGTEPVGEPLGSAPLGLGFLDSLDHSGEHGVVVLFGDLHTQHPVAVQAPAEDLGADSGLDRHRLSSHRAGVHPGDTLGDDAISGQAFTGAHEHHVTGMQFLHRNGLGLATVGDSVGGRGCQLHECADGPARTVGGVGLHRFTQAEDDDEHRGLLDDAQRDRPDHGHDQQHGYRQALVAHRPHCAAERIDTADDDRRPEQRQRDRLGVDRPLHDQAHGQQHCRHREGHRFGFPPPCAANQPRGCWFGHL